MKVVKYALMLMASVVMVSTLSANKPSPKESEKKEIVMKCYVDADKSGTCDKFEKGACKAGNGSGAKNCIPPRPKQEVKSGAGTETKPVSKPVSAK